MENARHSQAAISSDHSETAHLRRLLPRSDGNLPFNQGFQALPLLLVLGLIVLLAFPFTSLSLWTGLQTETPLAYQGLIPVLALATAIAQSWRNPTFVWRDSLTELIVALPFLLGALGLMYAGSRIGSIYFWYNRGDLLALALFGIGVAIVLFGVGTATRSWFAVLYLLLLWPAPYQDYLARAINRITDATVLAVDTGLQRLNWAGVTALGDAVYLVRGPDGTTQFVGVDSPCAGAAAMFGFLVVAIPAMYLLSGAWLRKFGWLAFGLITLWLLNVGRIFILFWIAANRGIDSNAFWMTHALLGIVLFTIVVVLMMYLGYRLGFRFEPSRRQVSAPSMVRIRRTGSTPLLVLLVLGLAVVLGSMNRDMVDAVGLSSRLADGESIQTFALTKPEIHRAQPRFVDQYEWSRQFFGRDSVYQRYAYRMADDGVVWVDTVVTSDRERLDLFNVQGCYRFHGYDLSSVATADIGYGIVAQQLQFTIADTGNRWIALSWTWPVESESGSAHERVTILQYVPGADATETVESQGAWMSALERLVGIGNGSVAVGPEADQVREVARAIVSDQLADESAGSQ